MRIALHATEHVSARCSQVLFLGTLTILIYVQYVTSTEFLTGLARKFFASGVNTLLYGSLVMGLELAVFRHISNQQRHSNPHSQIVAVLIVGSRAFPSVSPLPHRLSPLPTIAGRCSPNSRIGSCR